ncbi:TonB-dependent receptor plug domain-containing protein [Pseudoalteromonas sp. G4]|uniref:TonB-dependent receptor plug domain-containing protein n=1 Tax=Pseudoalteromonas sp. G4 TaxID=2992761 RepID=UPI00237E189E|nr:TonB-dependent receptor [Pseudoalteromonas sp. G4]MDE3271436.1 TonB-dependent receptor [Pseudoalteromonas sp. G4]
MKINALRKAILLACSSTLASAMSYSVSAEETPAAEEKKDVEKIAVVGTRSAPRSIGDSPVPIDIIGGDDLEKHGSSDMLELLVSQVPSFNVRQQPISDAATLIRPVNLRGLSSDSTLVLVNGKRRHRASVIAFQGGGVNDGAQGPDVSVIPSIALKQVEVLRDGAAAQYGSDAIAGVMNFVLKDASEGGSVSVKYGEYFEGDGDTTTIEGNVGLPFTDDGFANLSFALKNADPTSRSVQRPDAAGLAAAGNSYINNPAQIWGNPEIKDDLTIFGNVGLDLGNDKEFYMFGNYSERDAIGGFYYRNPHNRGNVYSIDGGETLLVGDIGQANGGPRTCAVVPANVPNVLETQAYKDMVADPNCFSMNMIFPGGYTPQFAGNIVDTSLTMGVEGEFKGGWLDEVYFDISGSVGRNASDFYLYNTLNPSLGLETPVDFDTGKYIQLEKTFNFDLVKSIEVGLDEPLNLAGGFEFREESFEIISGEEASWKAGPYADQGFNIGSHGFKGFGPESQGTNTRRNWAAYVDAEQYLTDNLLVGAALRYEDYNTFGDTANYKITLQYAISDDWQIRGSTSTGFRAPTVGQANVVNTATSLVNGELIQSFLAPPTDPLSAFYGGKELTPEESTSYALGTVYEYEDFFLTVDYYNIEVTDRIAQSSQIDVLESDYAELRSLGVQNPELISAVTYFANDFDTTTKGLDVVANYSADLLNGATKFALAYNWNETNVDSFNPATTSDGKVKRLEEGMPQHRATFTITQNWDDISMFVRANYFGEYFAVHADDDCLDGCWNEIADSAFTFDAEVSYFFTESFKGAIGANNIFDQEAQKLPSSSYGVLGAQYYESGPYDYNGGFYYVKLSYLF